LWRIAMGILLLVTTGLSGRGGEAVMRVGECRPMKHHQRRDLHRRRRHLATLLILRGGEGDGLRGREEGEMMDSVPSPSSTPPPVGNDDGEDHGAMQDADESTDRREERNEEDGGDDNDEVHNGRDRPRIQRGRQGGETKEVCSPDADDEDMLGALDGIEEKRRERESIRKGMHDMGVSSIPFDDDDEKTVVSRSSA